MQNMFSTYKVSAIATENLIRLTLLAINLLSAFIKESVDRLLATSMCTALVVKHKNMHPYLLIWLLPCLAPLTIQKHCHNEVQV